MLLTAVVEIPIALVGITNSPGRHLNNPQQQQQVSGDANSPDRNTISPGRDIPTALTDMNSPGRDTNSPGNNNNSRQAPQQPAWIPKTLVGIPIALIGIPIALVGIPTARSKSNSPQGVQQPSGILTALSKCQTHHMILHVPGLT